MGETMPSETINSRSYIKAQVPFSHILDEITIALRNNITDRQNRAVAFSETFTGDGTTTKFELTEDRDSKDRHKVMNIASLDIDGTAQTQWANYLCKYRFDDAYYGYVTFPNPPADSAEISVSGYKQYSMVFQEMPRTDLTTTSYPRISVQMGQAIGNEKDIKYDWDIIEVPIAITICDTGRNYADNLSREVWHYMKKNRRNFHFFEFIVQPKLSAFAEYTEDPNAPVYFQTLDYLITDLWERAG